MIRPLWLTGLWYRFSIKIKRQPNSCLKEIQAMFNIITGLSIVAHLVLIGLLLFCCFRTRSKGVIFITALLLTSGIFNSIFKHFSDPYIDQWAAGEISNWLTQSMTMGEFLFTVSIIKSFLYRSLFVFGVFLIYREWRHGKFHLPQPEHREELVEQPQPIS